ncbi:MAG: HAD family hydrolase [Phycisphaerales bacterium JB040]
MGDLARIEAVVCDVDGCLSPEFIGATDQDSHRRIRELTGELGLKLMLCTGRPLPFVDAMARVVGALELPSVCEGGVWLFDPASYTWSMDERIGEAELDAVRAAQRWTGEAFGVGTEGGVWFEAGKSASYTVFHSDVRGRLTNEIMPRIREEIEARKWPLRVSMTWSCVNVELSFVNKATGLDRFMARTGYSKEQLAGIGDTMSDLPIRERVSWFACPDNAVEEIKAHADYVSDASEAAGVVEILARLGAGGV